jgi:rsbT co-antagonist protein RsbR
MEHIIVMPLIGSIDSMRARDITRNLLAGIGVHRAKVVILDITGVPIVDSGVADHLNKTIQAARLKGARTIVTGISDAVAETVVDLGIDWAGVETLSDLQTGLLVALNSLGYRPDHSWHCATSIYFRPDREAFTRIRLADGASVHHPPRL